MRKLTAIALTLVLLLTGCTVAPVTPGTIPDAPIISDPDPVAPEPTPEKAARTYESVSVQLYEKDSYVYIFPVNAETTEVDGCRYYFEPTVSVEDREEFIEAQTALNKKLSAPEGLSFYVLRDYTFRSESENNLAFYEIGGTATWRQALAVRTPRFAPSLQRQLSEPALKARPPRYARPHRSLRKAKLRSPLLQCRGWHGLDSPILPPAKCRPTHLPPMPAKAAFPPSRSG